MPSSTGNGLSESDNLMDELFAKNAIKIEPSAEMRDTGIQLRSMFLSFTEAGFTEAQALQMLLTMLASNGGSK